VEFRTGVTGHPTPNAESALKKRVRISETLRNALGQVRVFPFFARPDIFGRNELKYLPFCSDLWPFIRAVQSRSLLWRVRGAASLSLSICRVRLVGQE
jgi:hypothetical protein